MQLRPASVGDLQRWLVVTVGSCSRQQWTGAGKPHPDQLTSPPSSIGAVHSSLALHQASGRAASLRSNVSASPACFASTHLILYLQSVETLIKAGHHFQLGLFCPMNGREVVVEGWVGGCRGWWRPDGCFTTTTLLILFKHTVCRGKKESWRLFFSMIGCFLSYSLYTRHD